MQFHPCPRTKRKIQVPFIMSKDHYTTADTELQELDRQMIWEQTKKSIDTTKNRSFFIRNGKVYFTDSTPIINDQWQRLPTGEVASLEISQRQKTNSSALGGEQQTQPQKKKTGTGTAGNPKTNM